MTHHEQQTILEMVRELPDAAPQLRAMGEDADGVVFFAHAKRYEPLYSTRSYEIAMGFVGGWIAAAKTLDTPT